MSTSILLIDDDKNLSRVTQYQLTEEGYVVQDAAGGRQGLDLLKENRFDLILLDMQMPEMDGIAVLKEIRKQDPEVPVVIITAYGTVDSALRATELGADDYITKPFSINQIKLTIERSIYLRRLRTENRFLKKEISTLKDSNILGGSAAIKKVMEIVRQVAPTDSTVLITGESGTGKELVARAIHIESRRAEKLFVPVNCAAIPETLIESELFGHTKGAFTGAVKDRKGTFQVADQGTLFLDEVGDLNLELQSKLLRVLQEQVIQKVGASESIKVDVRVIAATNRNIETMIVEGLFREDLFYRLNVIPLYVPPLRDRKEDIPDLVRHFFNLAAPGRNMQLTPDALARFAAYDWPGNIRELKNIVERIGVLARENTVPLELIPTNQVDPPAENINSRSVGLIINEDNLFLEDVEKQTIEFALRKSGGNKSRAARLLNVERHILLYRIKKLGIEG